MHVLTAEAAFVGAAAVAGWLDGAAIGSGDRVAIQAPKLTGANQKSAQIQAETIQLALGCLLRGVTPVMVNPALSEADQHYIINDCQPAAIINGTDFASVLASAPASVGRDFTARPMHYTSGTTGVAKGVWAGHLSADLLMKWWADEARAWPFEATDTTIVCGPLVHSAPLRFPLLTLQAGGNVVLPGVFDAAVVAQAINEHRPTTAFVVPTHLQRLLALAEVPTSSFRLLAHAGAACPEPLKLRIHEWAGSQNVWEFYGSTEGQFTQCHGPEWESRHGTLGRARPGRRLFTDDGVIWCEAPAASAFEYWNDPVKTAAAWRDLPDGGRAFSVGDLGRIDDDGYLYFEGRRTDLIITGGVNVYPAQVEDVVAHFAEVEQCAVFGVDDDEWGQIVCVAYVGEAAPTDVMTAARSQLAKYQVPKRVFPVAELPYNANGKLLRRELPDLLGLN